jgi:hypothetical protein
MTFDPQRFANYRGVARKEWRSGSFRIVFGVLFFVLFAKWTASIPWRKGWRLLRSPGQ